MQPFNPERKEFKDHNLFGQVVAINLDIQDVKVAIKLRAMIEYYGGQVEQEPNSNTTHIFSIDSYTHPSLPSASCKIVTPTWAIDSIKQNQLLNESIYDPKYLLSHKENTDLLERFEQEERDKLAKLNNQSTENQQPSTNKVEKQLNFVIIPQSMEAPTPSKPKPKENSESDEFFEDKNEKSAKKYELNMDDIFESVLASTAYAEEKAKAAELNKSLNISTTMTPTKAPALTPQKSKLAENNTNQLQSICLDIIKTTNSDTTLSFFDTFEELASVANSNSNNNVPSATQENSHLLQFECCLLGCVFYINLNESLFTKDSLDNWKVIIEKYAGRCVDSYDEHKDEITHVLSPTRSGEIYKKV